MAAGLVLLATGPLGAVEPARTVLLVVAGAPTEARELGLVARELLARLEVAVEVERAATIDRGRIASRPLAGSPFVAEAYLDFTVAGGARLFLLDPREGRLLVREVQRPAGGEELAREELGHILETAIEGLLSGQRIGVPLADALPEAARAPKPGVTTPADPTPPSSPVVSDEVPHTRSRAPLRLGVGAGFEVRYLGADVPLAPGPFVTFDARVARPRLAPTLWLTAQYQLPVHAGSAPVDVQVEGGAFRALGGATVSVRARSTLLAGLGAGADVVHIAPETSAPERYAVAEPTTQSYLALRGALGYGARLNDWASFMAWAGCEWAPSGSSYLVSGITRDQVLYSPARWRPTLSLGVGFP